jgi:hypothetical protein
LETYTVFALLLFCIIREYFFLKEINKLTDKVISKDFTEYSSGIVAIEAEKNKNSNKHDINKTIRI